MSHAANLRNRQRPDQAQLPSSKRRKLSAAPANQKPNGVTALVNGDYNARTFTAIPTRNAKPTSNSHPSESLAKITQPHDEKDVDMFAGDDSSEDAEDDEGDEDEAEAEDEDEDEDDGGEDGVPDEEGSSDVGDGDVDDNEDEPLTNGLVNGDHTNDNAVDMEAHHTEEPTSSGPQDDDHANGQDQMSFGDLLRSKGQEEINVEESFLASHPATTSLAPPPTNQVLSIPTVTSLGTVLTQALKINDLELLESCFQVSNLESIRATIERLHSSHATSLLQRLAERLHKRPGRAGSLMVWVQWTVVAHGGYLASQPAAMRELQTLYQVVKQRATGLQPLLALKGKLDMLEAQMQLRRNIQARSQGRGGAGFEQGVTYVEGQGESSSEDEAAFMIPSSTMTTIPKKKRMRTRTKGPKVMRKEAVADETDEEEEDEMPTSLPNGLEVDMDEDDSVSEDSDDDQDLIDDEAEETDDEDENVDFLDDVDYDDNDEPLEGEDGEDGDESEDERPVKRSRDI